MIAALLMINEREIVLHGDLMNLLEPPRYYADILESFFLKIFYKEPQDTFMVRAYF